MNKSAALALAITAAVASGCAYEPTCDYSDAPYMRAQSVPPLKAPDGLAAPDRSASLVIPPASPGAPPIPTGESRCLDRPPSYFATGSASEPKPAADTPAPASQAAPTPPRRAPTRVGPRS